MSLRSLLGRRPALRAARDRLRRGQNDLSLRVRPADFERLPPAQTVRLAYRTMLGREPDPGAMQRLTAGLRRRRLSRREIIDEIRASEEFANLPFPGSMVGYSLHVGRCQFIRSLPPARRIVDLGGTHLRTDLGAMVTLGYRYPFEELVIVDLPSGERHRLYQSGEAPQEVPTRLGPVRYRYHSMTDLTDFADISVDLVYSGQSIEHVTPDEAAIVLKEVFRILRPGGYFALDTPNGRVTRLQQAAFVDPDHKVEYTQQELAAKLEATGFEILEAKGLNYAGKSVADGCFDANEVAANPGLYWAGGDCYILCFVCRKPAG